MARLTQYESLKDIWVERQQFLARTIVAFVGCVAVSVVLLVRLFNLQIIEHAYYNTRSDDNRMRLVVVPPVRGLIYDRNGALLAQNQPSYVLEVTPERVGDLD